MRVQNGCFVSIICWYNTKDTLANLFLPSFLSLVVHHWTLSLVVHHWRYFVQLTSPFILVTCGTLLNALCLTYQFLDPCHLFTLKQKLILIIYLRSLWGQLFHCNSSLVLQCCLKSFQSRLLLRQTPSLLINLTRLFAHVQFHLGDQACTAGKLTNWHLLCYWSWISS